MFKENIIIPKEKQVEEVREIENTQQKRLEEKQEPTITESVKESIVPTVYASDGEEKKKEGFSQTLGYGLAGLDYANPIAGGAVSLATTFAGGIEEGIGKLTGQDEVAEGGKVVRKGATQPIEDLGKGIKKIFE